MSCQAAVLPSDERDTLGSNAKSNLTAKRGRSACLGCGTDGYVLFPQQVGVGGTRSALFCAGPCSENVIIAGL